MIVMKSAKRRMFGVPRLRGRLKAELRATIQRFNDSMRQRVAEP